MTEQYPVSMAKQYHELDDEDLARICHEAHLALRIGLNASADDMHFDALPQWRKDMVTRQVRLFREGKGPREVHQAWIETMTAQGWRYGTSRNLIQKTHPDMVPYDQLPVEEKAKVRQAYRIVFTHVLPDALEEIAYSDIRSVPVGRPDITEELPEVCVTHGHFAPCAEDARYCRYSAAAEDVDAVYRDHYEQ